MAGFDRIKPPAKRLEDREEAREPDSGAADVKGRAALFSASNTASSTTPPRRPRPDVRADVPPPGAPVAPPVTPPVAPPTGDRPPADDRSTTRDDPTAPGPPPGRSVPTGKSLLQVECSHCGVTCPMPLGTAVKRAFPLAVVLPNRSHPVFATCPCGERRTWLKPSVGLPR